MCVAVEREDAPRRQGARRERVIDILPRWIAVDFNCNASPGGRCDCTST